MPFLRRLQKNPSFFHKNAKKTLKKAEDGAIIYRKCVIVPRTRRGVIMKRVLLRDIHADAASFADQEVTVGGWARSVRDSRAFGFIDLNDGSCHKGVQVVFERQFVENFAEIAKLNVGAAIVVKGKLVLTPENKQPFEIKAEAVEVEGASTPDYPLQKKGHSVEFLREIAYLRPRTNLFSAVFRVRSEVAFAIHEFFHQRGFVLI